MGGCHCGRIKPMGIRKFFFKSEKNKAIALVTVVVVTLAVAFFYEGILLHSRTIDGVILDQKNSIDATINNIDRYSFAPYQNRLENLIVTHPDIAGALFNQERDLLYNLSLPLYDALQRENKHLHIMHYHLPDGHSFLRMHNRQKFGDDLRQIRPAVQHVHERKKPLSCYEIGIYGAFYRIIQPVFHAGSYAGALELGIRVHTILDSLQKQLHDPLTTFFRTDRWQKVIAAGSESITFGNYTLLSHHEPLYNNLPADLDLSKPNQELIVEDRSYLLHTFPIFVDYRDKPIGGFVVMQDITKALASKKTFIVRSLTFAALLLFIALVALHLSFGRLIDKLENSQASWERTFDAIGDIVTIMDSDLRIIRANKAAHTLLGAEMGSLIGKYCYEVFTERSTACEGCPGLNTIKHFQVDSAEIEHANLGKNFLITTSPVPDEQGNFTRIIHIAKDVTETKELERRLRQAQKMEAIGTLAGGIAHDFNNILTAIAGHTQLILMKAANDDKISHNARQVSAATQRAKELVTQILTFSRQTEHKKKSIEVALVIKEALKLLRSSIPTSIEVRQSIKSRATIMADASQIHQIVMNLATNAYQAMLETGGILGVSLQEITIEERDRRSELELAPGRYLRLEVSDTGCGMDRVTAAKIFEPYFTTKELGKGTGLGLAVVHGIVTSHHGLIHVYSEPGQGTTFHVYFPVVEAEAEQHLQQTEKKPVRGGDEHLMFVDDEEIITDLVQEVLSLYGYQVSIFHTGTEALAAFRKEPEEFDLIITDMTMPGMNGMELAAEIKTRRPQMPIILCSGHSEITNKASALTLGINEYIQKPLEMDDLARDIRQLLDNRKKGGKK